jgi:hypothetical protein
MTINDSEIKVALELAAEYIIKQSIERMEQQGHINTGASTSDMDFIIDDAGDGWVAQITIPDSLQLISDGFAANSTPFSPGSGAGHSLYIEGLLTWLNSKYSSLSGRNAMAFAQKIARTQKEDGMSTFGARSFSSDSTRNGWIEWVAENTLPELNDILDLGPGVNLVMDALAEDLREMFSASMIIYV